MVELTYRQKIGFGLGHIINDFVAAIWVTYFLLYYHEVLKFDSTYSGLLILIGQIFDAAATIFVGYFSDGENNFRFCRWFGERKSWHLFGAVSMILSVPFVFMTCVQCQDASESGQLVYYAAFCGIAQMGWGIVQISHLAMIPQLSHTEEDRTGLTAIRNAATVVSNIGLYLIAWAFFGTRESAEQDDKIGPKDDQTFRNIVQTSLAIGGCACLVFYLLVKTDSAAGDGVLFDELESSHAFRRDTTVLRQGDRSHEGCEDPTSIESISPFNDDAMYHQQNQVSDQMRNSPPSCINRESQIREQLQIKMTILNWLKQPQLYQVGLVYLAARVYWNMSLVYIPLYLQASLRLPATSVATVPLVNYISAFVASIILERSKNVIGKRKSFYIGAAFAIATSIWIHSGSPTDDNFTTKQIFGVAVFIGIGSSVMLVSSTALTADLIGSDVDSSAFIYGAMSLVDKLFNGTAVVIIQKYIPDEDSLSYRGYFKDILSTGGGVSVLVGVVALLSLWKSIIGTRRTRVTESFKFIEELSESAPLLGD